ncbi:MAG: ABC transporter ATP-binding protein [Clostridiales bacterium]
MKYIIEMLDISKEFTGIVANDDITFQVKPGEIHALLGENGAGKSTLMSILFGLYKADKGTIKLNNNTVKIPNPKVASSLGIGMVHQHFKLVHNFTVTENIILGFENTRKFKIDTKTASESIKELSKKYKLEVDPNSYIEDISVGMQQRVEILKMLYRKADILIFDEPTAVLTPQEIQELLGIMKEMRKEGKTIIIITHKISEIYNLANRCTVIRKGKVISTFDVEKKSFEEISELIIGRKLNMELKREVVEKKPANFKIENLSVLDNRNLTAVNNLSLSAKPGEILGIAGVEGNGQSELIEAITGLRKVKSGHIYFNNNDIVNYSIRKRHEHGIGHIPQDRHKHGLVLDFTLENNLILATYYNKKFSKNGVLKRKEIKKHSEELINQFDIRAANGSNTICRSMSGGNQQKVIIAREIDQSPSLLIVAHPTRGLDIGAIEYIHGRLLEERKKGKTILLFSFELDEILKLSDRIAIMYNGKIVDTVVSSTTNENEIGLMMVGGIKNG